MLDPRLLRNALEDTAAQLKRRGFDLDVAKVTELETRRKALQVSTQELQNERNRRSKSIGKAKASGEDIAPLLAEVGKLGDDLKAAEAELGELQQALEIIAMGIPNIPHASTPDGESEDDNVEIRRWGEPKSFGFELKDHVDVGEGTGGLDFETAVKITGSRFAVMTGDVARMHRALTQFMLDTHTRTWLHRSLCALHC